MANRIVLISDDSDFFDFIREKLFLRKSDELFTFSFADVLKKRELLLTAVLIINSENAQEQTLETLKLFKGVPSIVSTFNEDTDFKKKCYTCGIMDYIPLLTPESEFQARITPALSVATLLEKNQQYRNILTQNNVIMKDREVFLDYSHIIDQELEKIDKTSKKAIFVAISPDDKTKFLIQPETVEKTILNNIRRNDILMNYAVNKYFLFLFDTDLISAQKLWDKIRAQIPQKLYAGFSIVLSQKRQQLVNETLNKLHEAISYGKDIINTNTNPISTLSSISGTPTNCSNFKQFRQEFTKKLEQVINPVFYQIQQKYTDKFNGITFQHGFGEGYGTFYIKGKYHTGSFRVTSPGFSKINIDITYQKSSTDSETKRIILEPEELESGLVEDLLEQFIQEGISRQTESK